MKENKPILSHSDRLDINKKEFIVPTDRYLFLDLDMTLIDESRNINDQAIRSYIEKMQSQGWNVGLNSNTPFEPLLVWMQYFGMNGPFIAEKGSVVYNQGKLKFDEKLARLVQSSRESIRQRLSDLHIQMLFGNPPDVLREYPFNTIQTGPVVILDTVRKNSINFFVREVTSKKQVVVNVELAQTLTDVVRSLYQNIPNLEEKFDDVRGNLLATQRDQSKRTGVHTFMREAKLTQVGMIGDSMNDYLGEIAVHYAVSNATKDFQEKAVFVSNFPMAQGSKDIIQKLLT